MNRCYLWYKARKPNGQGCMSMLFTVQQDMPVLVCLIHQGCQSSSDSVIIGMLLLAFGAVLETCFRSTCSVVTTYPIRAVRMACIMTVLQRQQ